MPMNIRSAFAFFRFLHFAPSLSGISPVYIQISVIIAASKLFTLFYEMLEIPPSNLEGFVNISINEFLFAASIYLHTQ